MTTTDIVHMRSIASSFRPFVHCAPQTRSLASASRWVKRELHAIQSSGHPTRPSSSTAWGIDQAGEKADWLRQDLNLVLVHPQIPQNTGTIARTCAATAVGLHLVKPLGFEVTSSRLKRAGLDYWPYVTVKIHESWQDFMEYYALTKGSKRLIGFSKFATVHYATPGLYQPGDFLLMGAETDGLPDYAWRSLDAAVVIPIIERHVRSLNVSVAAGIGLYEAIRQIDSLSTSNPEGP